MQACRSEPLRAPQSDFTPSKVLSMPCLISAPLTRFAACFEHIAQAPPAARSRYRLFAAVNSSTIHTKNICSVQYDDYAPSYPPIPTSSTFYPHFMHNPSTPYLFCIPVYAFHMDSYMISVQGHTLFISIRSLYLFGMVLYENCISLWSICFLIQEYIDYVQVYCLLAWQVYAILLPLGILRKQVSVNGRGLCPPCISD